MKEKYSYSKVTAQYSDLESERSEWEAEWRQISTYLLPGRGIYNTYSKPQKRKLTSGKVINSVAEDSLYVLTSGMHGGLTSPSRPWFNLEWEEAQLNTFEPLKAWLQECTTLLHTGLQLSNFYSIINSFYIEYAGFGTGCTYVGEDSDDAPFRFELLTAGEYVFSVGASGKPAVFMRPIFMTPRQLVERFPKTASKELKKKVSENSAGVDKVDYCVLECVYREPYEDKAYTRYYYEVISSGNIGRRASGDKTPLEISGFYEFPYPIARWGTIGSDIYGIGPGSRALPDIKRLQEMEKAFLMATHKTINPPLNAPASMRGKLNSLPGGKNYYSNPNFQVNELYRVNFDYQGVSMAVDRVEERIRRNFFNDIFLTAVRDPNASPLKATEVNARDQEKMLRLGPVIERLQFEYLQPLIERCFNIMLRKELMPPLSPELEAMAGGYKISLVSPLATAQRSIALQGINSFMSFVSGVAQFNQAVLDNVDVDAAAREHANINGVRLGILRPEEEVKRLRAERAKAMAVEKEKQEKLMAMQADSAMNKEQAETQKIQSEAGLNMVEGQQVAVQAGMA